MSDIKFVALCTLIPAVLTLIIQILSKRQVNKIERQTNSLTHALVESTGAKANLEGQKEGAMQERARAGDRMAGHIAAQPSGPPAVIAPPSAAAPPASGVPDPSLHVAADLTTAASERINQPPGATK